MASNKSDPYPALLKKWDSHQPSADMPRPTFVIQVDLSIPRRDCENIIDEYFKWVLGKPPHNMLIVETADGGYDVSIVPSAAPPEAPPKAAIVKGNEQQIWTTAKVDEFLTYCRDISGQPFSSEYKKKLRDEFAKVLNLR